jgi:hypothetical protein
MGRRAALAALAALLAALLVAGCGGGKNAARRKAVDGYLQQVSAVQREAQPALTAANGAYRRFWAKHKTRADAKTLVRAAATIRALQNRMSRLTPPPDARVIHRDLISYLGLEASFADEVSRLGTYLPATRAPLARLAAANKQLRADFSKTHTAVAQSHVIAAYAVAVRGVAAGLSRLVPPQAMRTWHAALVRRLTRVASTSTALNIVLTGTSRAAIVPAAQAFRDAVALASPPPQVLRRALIRFNAGAARISTLGVRIRKEYSALDTKLL